MTLQQLRAFYFVGKYGSLIKAANYLKLTPPAISLQLKKLEAELSATVFERHPNRLALTPKGQILLKEINQVFDALTRMQQAISDEPAAYSGKVTIALGRDLTKFFAPQIAAFSRRHSRLKIAIVSVSSPEAVNLVLKDDVDVAISRVGKVPRGIQKRRLLESSLYLIFPSKHHLVQVKKISFADIAAHPLILHASGSPTREAVQSSFSAEGIEIENIIEVATCDAIIDFVRLGLGIGLVHDICLPTRKDKRLSWREMTVGFENLEVSMMYKKSAMFKPSHKSLIDALAKMPAS